MADLAALLRRLRPARRRAPLVLADGASTRALAAIVAILTFLAALAAGAAELVSSASAAWTASISREATIQLRPLAGRDVDGDLARAEAIARAHPGVVAAQALSRGEAEELLEPWLGRGLDLSALPVPRLVALTLAPGGAARLPALRARLAAEIPGASVDDHGAWLGRLSGLARSAVGMAAALVGLVLGAAGLAVAFATRGAMAGSREAVEVLHLVGADERFVARTVALGFLRLGLGAGAAGAAAAALAFPLAGRLLAPLAAPGSESLSGSLAIGWRGHAVVGLIALAVGAIAGGVSAVTVRRLLRGRF